jgi:hypothetical protein
MKSSFKAFLNIAVFIFSTFFIVISGHAQWQPDMRLTNDPGSSYLAFNNARGIATEGNFIHVVWYDDRDTNTEIYYKRSTDGGTTWSADARLTNTSALSVNPSVAVLGSNVHIVWQEGQYGGIYYKQSTDNGLTWGSNILLSNNSTPSSFPCLAVSLTALHVVWSDPRTGDMEIYYKRSTNGGLNWESDVRLTNDPAVSTNASVAVSGAVVHVVWSDERTGTPQIFYKRSTDDGVTWESDVQLTNNPGFSSSYPCISVSDSTVHVVWYDNRDGNYEIYYERSSDAGTSWGAEQRLTQNSALSYNPSVSASDSNVSILWVDNRDGNRELYYKHSRDSGLSWSDDTRLTNDPFDSYFASVSELGSVVNVAWVDTRDGNAEIYFKQNPNVNYPPPAAPFNLTALAVSTSRINLNWTDTSSVEEGFKIERSTNPAVFWKLIDSLGANITSYADTGLDPGTIYYYRLYAFNFVGNSQYSNTAFDTTLVVLPSAPFNLTALAVSPTGINLKWADTSSVEDGFKIERSTNAGINWAQIDSLGQDIVTYADTGLTPSTIYYYRLYSFNSYGISPYSNIAFDTTFILAPIAPTLLSPLDSASGQSLTPTLEWTTVPGAETYEVQVSPHFNFDTLIVDVTGLDSSHYTVPSNILMNLTWYYWRAKAVNTTGASPWSVTWSFQTLYDGLNTYSNEIPKVFKLYNNFPNPFNPSTKIRFDIPKVSKVNIIVYDILGRETAKIFDNILQPGKFEILWNASSYPSGVYFYRIIAGDYVDAKKMVLVK